MDSITLEPFTLSYFLMCTAKFSNGTEIPAHLGIITLDDGTKVYPQHTEITLSNGTIVPSYPVEFRFLHGSFNINQFLLKHFLAKMNKNPKTIYTALTSMTHVRLHAASRVDVLVRSIYGLFGIALEIIAVEITCLGICIVRVLLLLSLRARSVNDAIIQSKL